MTKQTKKYTLTAQNIQAYLCELGIKPTEEVSIFSIEYYFDKLPVTTDKLSVEKLQEQLNTAKKALTNIKLRTERDELETYYVERNHDIRKDAIDALAAIGGDDD